MKKRQTDPREQDHSAEDIGALPHNRHVVERISDTLHQAGSGAARHALVACAGISALVILAVAAIIGLLYAGPVRVDFLREKIVAELAASLGGQDRVSVASMHLALVDGAPAARLGDMTVRDSDGRVVLNTPAASIVFDPLSLLGLRLAPKRLAVARLTLRLDIHPDGRLAVAAGDAPDATPAAAPPALPVSVADRSHAVVTALAGFEKAFADNGFLDQLQAVSVTDARLIIRHLGSGREVAFDHVELNEHRDGPEARTVTVQGAGPRGPLKITLQSSRDGSGYRTTLAASDIALSDLATLAGLPALKPETDPGITLQGSAVLNAGRDQATIDLDVGVGGTRFSLDGTAGATIALDQSVVSLHWESADGNVIVRRLGFVSGDTRGDLTGALRPDPAVPGRFSVELASKRLSLAALSKDERPLDTLRLAIAGTLDTTSRTLGLRRIAIAGPGYDVTGEASFTDAPEGAHGAWRLQADHVPVREALRIWPTVLSPEVRGFLVDNLTQGRLDHLLITSTMPPAAMKAALGGKPMPDDSIRGDYVISAATLTAVPGLPPLRDAAVTGNFTGRTATVNVASAGLDFGNKRRLTLSEGRFLVADTASRPSTATVAFRLQGGADAAAEMLARPPIRPKSGQIVDPAQVKGTVDLRATLKLPLVPNLKAGDVSTTVAGTLGNLSVDKAFGTERLENATLSVAHDDQGTSAKGEGKIFGTQATLSLKQAGSGAGDVQVQFTADDTLRSKRNLIALPGLKGPVVVTAKAPLQKTGPDDATSVTLDLTKAALDDVIPGWSKPAGSPAKVSFNYQPAKDGARLTDFSLDASPAALKGQVALDTDGNLRSAHLDSFKLSASDSLRVDVERSGAGYKTTIRGNSLDARPFLKQATHPVDAGGAKTATGKAKESDVDLKVAIVSGFNGEALANVGLKVATLGRDLRQLALTGKLDGSVLRAGLDRPTNQGGVIAVDSADAGAFLRFVDIYPRMRGGRLALRLSGPPSRQDGTMNIRDFVLHDEPALRSMFGRPGGVTADGQEITGATAGADVRFTKLKADFLLEPNRITFRDSVMWGQQVGGQISGTMDYGRDRVNLNGTFVPAYQVNNMFAQVPLLGPLLGGGQYEGLFAVSFQITGKASAPVLHINPLSAIAPGFLRKLLDFRQQPEDRAGTSSPAARSTDTNR